MLREFSAAQSRRKRKRKLPEKQRTQQQQLLHRHWLQALELPLAQAAPGKIKMATIINQTNDDKIEPLPEDKIKTSFEHYKKITGGFPPSQKECTIEQLSGLQALVVARAAPYVDFNIWGPHQYRIMKKLKLQGMVLLPGGEMRHIEIPGPSTFPLWEGCFDELETGLVQLDIVKLARTATYHDIFRH